MYRLVIADDERVIRETIASLIDWRSLDIEVVAVCKNGSEAYDAILDEYPDLVLTDIRMPGMSGLELIRRLREAGGQMEFVILSGYGEFEYAKQAMQMGVRHYLLKPCNEKQIIEVMQQAKLDFERSRRIQELGSKHGAPQADLRRAAQSTAAASRIVSSTLAYMREHLADPELSLKSIAENCLFMNVDYVSKQFVKSTGQRFSACLRQMRVEKAKQLLQQDPYCKISAVAEQVGCGNNPQYFNYIFKKQTGLTPGAYQRALQ